MTMCIYKAYRLQIQLFNEATQFILFSLVMTARVQDNTLLGLIVNNISVFQKGIKGKMSNSSHIITLNTVKIGSFKKLESPMQS